MNLIIIFLGVGDFLLCLILVFLEQGDLFGSVLRKILEFQNQK